MKFSRDLTLDEIMNAWPATIRVLLRYRMLCIGCPIAKFHTVVDAAHEHKADLEEFERSLMEVIAMDQPGEAAY